jgi:serine/threonine protein kinase/tetratricopeptide (TPR) repeat protein
MGTSDLPIDHPDSDRTLGAGAPVAVDATQIGQYRLLQMLGEGGMGEVWLAEQKEPIRRTVALKLIKAGMDTKAVVARFESERQALALMDHPNIAQVYDAGSTAEGRPYFVMEYVPGLPITEHCDKHRLTIKERLELFMQVCDGLQHAHQKAIIHRDMKPSNVLVVEHDNKAVPKIIDFGLAKATAQRLTDKTMFTELGVMVGTPEYMSPEQMDQREQNIDTRTDVYSLGVILYQLLVGALPFEAKALRAAGLEAILRVIREQEPTKPSTKIRSMGEASAASAEKRKEKPRSLAQHLQGELDWITMKALEKDRVRRYGTASELSADILRYLRSEPVLAGPATTGYRIRKYAARHRLGLGVAAGSLVLLIGFVITQAVELHRITIERDRATRERDRADRITDFMTRMFKVSDPSEARGNSITVREILDKASADIDNGLTKDPELQAQMMSVMGGVYYNLGLSSRAQLLQQGALEIRRRVLGPENPDTLNSMNSLAVDLMNEGQFAEAEKLMRETLDIRRRVFGPENPETLNSMNSLATVLSREGRYTEAEKLMRETLDIRRRLLGTENPDTLSSTTFLAGVLSDEGHYTEAEKLLRETLDIQRRVLGPEDQHAIDSMNYLAADLVGEARLADAEKLFREALDIERRMYGAEDRRTLGLMYTLGSVLRSEGHYREAEKLDQQSLDIHRRMFRPDDPITIEPMNDLATDLLNEGHYAEAKKLIRESLDIQHRVPGLENMSTTYSTYDLGRTAALQGRRDEALSLLRAAVDHGWMAASVDLGINKDPDLKSLHGDPRFAAIVENAKKRAAAAQKPN